MANLEITGNAQPNETPNAQSSDPIAQNRPIALVWGANAQNNHQSSVMCFVRIGHILVGMGAWGLWICII